MSQIILTQLQKMKELEEIEKRHQRKVEEKRNSLIRSRVRQAEEWLNLDAFREEEGTKISVLPFQCMGYGDDVDGITVKLKILFEFTFTGGQQVALLLNVELMNSLHFIWSEPEDGRIDWVVSSEYEPEGSLTIDIDGGYYRVYRNKEQAQSGLVKLLAEFIRNQLEEI